MLRVGETYTTKNGQNAVVVAELKNIYDGYPSVFLGYVGNDPLNTTAMLWGPNGGWFSSSSPKSDYSITLQPTGAELWNRVTSSDDQESIRALARAYRTNSGARPYLISALLTIVPCILCGDKDKAVAVLEYLK